MRVIEESPRDAAPTRENLPRPAPVGAASRDDYVQDERYIAIEHMDVRRDRFSFARGLNNGDRLRRLVPQETA